MTTEISVNLASSRDDSLYRALANFDTPENLHSKTHVTFIEPQYDSVYRSGILPIVKGIVASTIELVELNDGQRAHASVYGILDLSGATFKGEATSMLAVNVHQDFIDMLDDPEAALDAYHKNLINQTNGLLDGVESPYRLAQIIG